MRKMSPLPAVSIAVRIRAWRIPVSWAVVESTRPELIDFDGRIVDKGGTERLFWPTVLRNRWNEIELLEIENPLDLRVKLFKVLNNNRSEDGALAFLNSVGAWDGRRLGHQWEDGTFVNISFGHRQVFGLRIIPFTLDGFFGDASRWYELLKALRNPKKLKIEFRSPPPADARPYDLAEYAGRASFDNTLPVSLEWQGKHPYAVIETITGCELMIAAAWTDVLSQSEDQVCAECKTRFSWPRKKKYCRWECGHLVAVRKYKRKLSRLKQKNKERLSNRRIK